MKTLSTFITEMGAAEFIKQAGCSKAAAYHWRSGYRHPNAKWTKIIAARFGLTVRQIRPDLYE